MQVSTRIIRRKKCEDFINLFAASSSSCISRYNKLFMRILIIWQFSLLPGDPIIASFRTVDNLTSRQGHETTQYKAINIFANLNAVLFLGLNFFLSFYLLTFTH